MKRILKCPSCNTYTLEETCPKCNKKTISSQPPKLPEQDKYGHLRREAKKKDWKKQGLY
ncbi:ribosome biogenesis protein [Candidatus Woesearchaeota archaeon]|jgi:H/ACA ribonucleoprotein complex subunit 3|nr:ribosome biogenesis protein [Candidatus Woesearchaeota archaeon]